MRVKHLLEEIITRLDLMEFTLEKLENSCKLNKETKKNVKKTKKG